MNNSKLNSQLELKNGKKRDKTGKLKELLVLTNQKLTLQSFNLNLNRQLGLLALLNQIEVQLLDLHLLTVLEFHKLLQKKR